MKQGSIIEFIEDSQIFTGYVTQVEMVGSGARTREVYKVLTEKDRVLNVQAGKIINHENSGLGEKPSHDKIIERLLLLRDKRRAAAAQVPLAEIWELSKLEDSSAWLPVHLARAYYGQNADPDTLSSVIRALNSKNPYFRKKDDYFYASTDDELKRHIEAAEREKLQKEQEEIFARDVTELFKCNFSDPARSSFVQKYPDKINALLSSFIYDDNASFASKTAEIMKRIGELADIKPDAFRFLVKLGVIDEDENFLIRKHKIKENFQPATLAEVEKFKHEDWNAKYVRINPDSFFERIVSGLAFNFKTNERVDLSGIDAYTIDGERTTCCDDAVSLHAFKNYNIVMVHIADISELVTEGCEIDREAFARATSIYLSEKKIDMLPEEISSDRFSLKEGSERLSLSLASVFAEDGSVGGSFFFPSIIKTTKKCSYGGVNEILEDECENAGNSMREYFSKLLEISGNLKKSREKRGANTLFFPKIEIHVDKNEAGIKTVEISRDDHGKSGLIVSEMMLLYNSAAAIFLARNGATALFKSSKPFPSPELLEKYAAENGKNGYDPAQAWAIRRSMPHADSAYTIGEHSLLGLDGYVQASSPLRRYVDILTQRQIKGIIYGAPQYSMEEFSQKILYCDNPLSAAYEVEQESYNYWLFKHLKEKCGETFGATVIEASEDRARIEIGEYFVHVIAAARTHGKFACGEKISLTIEGVDVRNHRLHFSVSRTGQ